MGDEHRREVVAGGHLGQKVEELRPPGGVHAGGGLVEQQEPGVVDEGPGQEGALGFAPGEAGERPVGSFSPQTRASATRARLALVAPHAHGPARAARGHQELHDGGRKVGSEALALGQVADRASRLLG